MNYFLRFLTGWLVFTLVLSSTSMAQEQPQAASNTIYLPLVQQNHDSSEEIVLTQPAITIQGTVEQVVSEFSANQLILSRAAGHVKEEIEGVFSGDRLIIRYEGGTVGDVTLRVSHQPVLAAGMELWVKLYQQANGEYVIDNVDDDLTILNAEVFASFVLYPYRWQNADLPVPIRINPNNADIAGTAEADAIRRAMDTWNTFTGSFFEFADGGNSTCTANGTNTDDDDAIFCVVWQDSLSSGNALATTHYWFRSDQLTHIDMIFWGRTTGADTIWSTNPTGANQFDVESVALHEFGHALGLDHETCCDAVMNPTIGANQLKRTLRSDDHKAVTAQYTPNLTTSFVDRLAPAGNFTCTDAIRCRTVRRGVKHVADNGTVRISPGNYPETMVISRSVTLVSTGDMVTIG